MTLKLEVGKRYLNGKGEIITVERPYVSLFPSIYPGPLVLGSDRYHYNLDGTCPGVDSSHNLLSEYVEEPPMPVTYAVKEPESVALVPDPACPRAEVDPTGKSAKEPGAKTELDPFGRSSKEPGSKLDADRVDVTLLTQFPRALEEVARVGDYGQNKYTRGGWLTVPDGIRRYTRAMMAHLFKEQTEGTYDQDPHPQMQEPRWKNKIRHDAQVAWNALARLELTLREGK